MWAIPRARGSRAIAYYNKACAYAMWSLAPEVPSEKIRDALRREGLASLQRSVDAGYQDWPWMEQDRDLDAIRGLPGYADLVKGIKASFPHDPTTDSSPGGASPTAPETPPPGLPPETPPRAPPR